MIVSCFQDEKYKERLNLPRTQDSTEKTYKYIEGTTKRIWEGYCTDRDSDKELYLAEGYCIIACGGRPGEGGCKTILPQRLPLESVEDWSEIETVVQNYEQSDDKHKNIRIAITRKLDLCKKTVGMADLPPKEKNIRTWMWKAIHKAKVRSASEKSQEYIPKDELHKFTTEAIIRRVVEDALDVACDPSPDARDELAKKIYQRAPILFAIFIYARVPLSLLETMLDKDIDDNMKILPRDCPSCLSGILEEDEIHYTLLVGAQWSFKAVFFDIVGKDYQLQADEIVPFISRAQCGKGASSLVYKAMIHRSHHRFSNTNENPELAVKVINSHRRYAHEAFKNERLVVKGLQDLTHDHIIKLLATYTQEGVYHFIFPLAQCSLEQYMEVNPRYFNNPDSDESKEFVAWIFGQFAGVASGIAAIHVKSTEAKNSSKEEVTATLLDPNVEKEREERPAGTGYHHDIKPQNLLLLGAKPESNSHGIIQIADFGIGKFHSIHSGTGTTTYRGTVTYAAPESKVPEDVESPGGSRATKKLNLSRPYDVWSLGCVLMEVTVWLAFGTISWEQFNSARDGPESCELHASITNSFFKLDEGGNPTVRQAVKEWMDKLRKSTRLRDPNGSLAGLLSLVEEVLNVNPRERMSAKDLTEKLTALANLAKKEAHISSLENQRRGITTPVSNTPSLIVEDHDDVRYHSDRTPPRARAQPRAGILRGIARDGTAGSARSRSMTPTGRNPLPTRKTESPPLSVHFAEHPPMSSPSRAETWKTTTTNSSLEVAPSLTRQDREHHRDN
ncbi:kinase-like domain-containing protein [Rhexocercosporidium sp. MPI-PUGE-AT-0058]|nr:kinase-like domain-containing protein [Rhexocercosporidium sp. MPI-PUGE-AT-0058]